MNNTLDNGGWDEQMDMESLNLHQEKSMKVNGQCLLNTEEDFRSLTIIHTLVGGLKDLNMGMGSYMKDRAFMKDISNLG